MSDRAARFERRAAARRAQPQPAPPEPPRPEERRADPPLTGAALDKRLRELGLAADRRVGQRRRYPDRVR